MLIGLAAIQGAGSGKTFAANYLGRTDAFKILSFADPLYALVQSLTGWSYEEIQERKEEPIEWLGGKSCRDLLRSVGTEWGREMIHPDIWINSLVRKTFKYEHCVVQDLRFENEASTIRAGGGFIIHIDCPSVVSRAAEHISESGLKVLKQDYVVLNNRTDDFKDKLNETISKIRSDCRSRGFDPV